MVTVKNKLVAGHSDRNLGGEVLPSLSSADEEVWEDLDDEDHLPSQRPPSVSGSRHSASSQRRRAPGTKPVSVAAAADSPHRSNRNAAVRQRRQAMREIGQDRISIAVETGARYTVSYVVDVIGTALRLLRKPLGLILFLWILSIIISRLQGMLSNVLYPFCLVYPISNFVMCAPHYHSGAQSEAAKWADFPKLANVQSTTFEQLLDESVGGSGLSLEVRKAEMATADLVTLVQISNLKSKDTLAQSLTEFVKDAKKTARGLTKLSSKVGGAVDNIMAVNSYALHTIQEAQQKTDSPYSFRALIPFRSQPPVEEVVLQAFTDAMDLLSRTIRRLILEAEISLVNLNRLEEDLSTIYEIVSREDDSISSAKTELLADLWTKLGGNRRTLRNYDDHLLLLRELGNYRRRALAHVVAAMQTLDAMSEDMEDLRERVAAPELTDGKIPLAVHIRSIQSGLQRLQEGRVRAKEREDEALRQVLTIGSTDE